MCFEQGQRGRSVESLTFPHLFSSQKCRVFQLLQLTSSRPENKATISQLHLTRAFQTPTKQTTASKIIWVGEGLEYDFMVWEISWLYLHGTELFLSSIEQGEADNKSLNICLICHLFIFGMASNVAQHTELTDIVLKVLMLHCSINKGGVVEMAMNMLKKKLPF